MDDKYVSTGIAARILGVGIQTVIRMADAGVIRSWRIPIGCRERRVNLADVRALLPPPKAKEGASDVVDAPQ